jgi:hypothetical protein
MCRMAGRARHIGSCGLQKRNYEYNLDRRRFLALGILPGAGLTYVIQHHRSSA